MCVKGISKVLLMSWANVVQAPVLQQFAISRGVAGGQRSLQRPALPWASPPRVLAGQWDGFVSIEFQLFSGKYLLIEIEEL